MSGRFRHFIGIDWSGAVGERQRGIAVAAIGLDERAPRLVRPGHIWSRREIVDWLSTDLPADSLVGMDLGPSLPFVDRGAYFPGWTESPSDAHALWRFVERLCADDPHLAATGLIDHPEAARHFRRHGGRTGDLFGAGRGRWRATEHAQAAAGLRPTSNLNLVGAAQVGKASLSGMRVLHRLEGRLPVWPIDADPGTGSLLVEIYTALAARDAGRPPHRAKLTDMAALNAALAQVGSAALPGDGPIDDHRSDALLAAAWLRRAAPRSNLWHPERLSPLVARTEGWTFGVV